jgi:hypothetical protein
MRNIKATSRHKLEGFSPRSADVHQFSLTDKFEDALDSVYSFRKGDKNIRQN